MPGVDALLNLLVAQGAEALVLSAGEVPAIVKGGEERSLSMPPLDGAILARFVEELRGAGVVDRYVLEARGARRSFEVSFGGSARLEMRLSDAGTSAGTGANGGTGTGAARPAPTRSPSFDHAGADFAPAREDVASLGAGRDLEPLVQRALEVEATDLFLSTAADARMRIDREVAEIPGTRCTAEAILDLLRVDEAQRELLRSHGSLDLGLDLGGGRVRANVFKHREGIAAVLRPIQRRIRTLAELNLPGDLRALAEFRDGLVLMVGPAGSGKSSTLAALIDHLNCTRAYHIVTLEDPVEFEHAHGRSLIHQRELGRDVESFAAGLRAALREGPDVILVGEMRDSETIAAALTAAETGHLVLSTLHSGGAAMAVDRIVDAFPPHQQGQVRLQLASVLRAIVTQLLLPSTRPGRLVPAIEKTIVTHAVAHAIREGRGHQIASQIQTGREDGMLSLEISLADLVRRGEITRETAHSAVRNPELLRELLKP